MATIETRTRTDTTVEPRRRAERRRKPRWVPAPEDHSGNDVHGCPPRSTLDAGEASTAPTVRRVWTMMAGGFGVAYNVINILMILALAFLVIKGAVYVLRVVANAG